MSITKGAMLISNANAVGAELVNKLGGTGYKPVEWADAINLLGISNDDKASALAGITEGTYTGDARGSIKYSNCNAVGSMLNKKFSTDRGFKPVEWESAISKLTPLAEDTVSGSVVSFSDGADDVPTKSLVVTIPPTLSGVSSVSVARQGKNLLVNNIEDGATGGITYTKNSDGSISCSGTVSNVNSTRLIGTQVLPIGSYILSGADSSINLRAVLYDSNGSVITNRNDTGSGVTISVDSTVSYIEIRIKARTNAEQVSTTISPMLAVGSTVQTYEPYNGTTYTASLGRTVYGGNADIVNGVGSEQGYKVVVDGTNIYFSKQGNYYNSYPRPLPTLGNPWKLLQSDEISFGYNSTYGFIFLTVARAEELGLYSAEEVNAYFAQNPTTIILNLATPTDFTFTGQEIPTRLGVNNFWSDSGDTEVTYRKDPDIPDQPVQLLDMNNNENNDN